MTLNTGVYFLDPIDPVKVHTYCNELLGAVNPKFNHRADIYGSGHPAISNEPGQGYPAWLFVHYQTGGVPLETLCTLPEHFSGDERWDLQDACENGHTITHYVRVDFDTSYGYNDELGGCTELHARYIFQLAEWAQAQGVRIGWQNEYSGEYFAGIEGLEAFISSGENAMDWFNNIAIPKLNGEKG